MKIRSALFLMAAAGGLVPPGAGNGAGEVSEPILPGSGEPKPKADDKTKEEKPSDALRQKWKGKSYAEIAAHHVSLVGSGQLDEAAEFHAAVVKTFKDKK